MTKCKLGMTLAFVSALIAAVSGARFVEITPNHSVDTPHQTVSTILEANSRAEPKGAAAQGQQADNGSSQKHSAVDRSAETGSINPCKLPEERLGYLGANLNPEELLRFVRELSCAQSWPEMSSLAHPIQQSATDAVIEPRWPDVAEATHPDWRGQSELPHAGSLVHSAPSADEASPDDAQSCKLEEARLVRLRASPNRQEVIRFADKLRCEDLRPQVARLLEMFSDSASPDLEREGKRPTARARHHRGSPSKGTHRHATQLKDDSGQTGTLRGAVPAQL
jgi:hypothetical protein